jgi:TolB-like protein/Flp pilus assembly protein TadD
MGDESPKPASPPTAAVFLSYASQDAGPARKICDTLRAAGIEVWFDRSELRGGDAWDRQIREQIHDCRLFIPIISANTESRDEGYFRREWSLAADRTRDMAHRRAFLLPVVIDSTPERNASVPEKFHELQWTRLQDGETTPAFVERVRRLLSPEAPSARVAVPASPISTVQPSGKPVSSPGRFKTGLGAIGVALALAVAYIAVDKFLGSRHSPPLTQSPAHATGTDAPPSAGAAAFNPPPHSIAVLPFVNMSGDKEQEYFSDGLSEELLNSLARISELQVAARTSSFYFKSEHADLATIAHRLNVASVLEGSVRRSAQMVRVTAQLNNAVTGYHLWSETYDRNLKDVLEVQTEIANAVATALKVTLLGDVAAKVELGGTRNPAAFDMNLRALKAYREAFDVKSSLNAIASYTEALRLDPKYALAYSGRSLVLSSFAGNWAEGATVRDYLNRSEADARKAVELAPELAEGHMALAEVFRSSLEFTDAAREYERAFALEPGNARLLRGYSDFAVLMGKTEAGLAAARRAVVLDPLNFLNHLSLGSCLVNARRYDAGIMALMEAKALNPNDRSINGWLGYAYYWSSNFEAARAACEGADEVNGPLCLAMVYYKLGRHVDAERALAKLRHAHGDAFAEYYAAIYAQWGDTAPALDSLETAMRHRNPGLEYLKVEAFDPLRSKPRFRAVEQQLKFPN